MSYVKETYNRFQDEDGCPDLSPDTDAGIADTDGDGFPDYLDLCPNDAETFNGIDDTDGCPDDDHFVIDNDQDGISDAKMHAH